MALEEDQHDARESIGHPPYSGSVAMCCRPIKTSPVQDPGTTNTITEADKRRLGEQFPERVTTILKEGGTGINIFDGMADYMAEFKMLDRHLLAQ